MITALVLLYAAAALGARLRVGLDPAQVLAVALLFFEPEVNMIAGRRNVSLLSACDALRSATGALDRVKDAVIADLNQIIALLVGTPLDIFAVVCELTTMPSHIL